MINYVLLANLIWFNGVEREELTLVESKQFHYATTEQCLYDFIGILARFPGARYQIDFVSCEKVK